MRFGVTRQNIQYPSLHHRYAHDIANVLVLRAFGVYAVSGRVRWQKRRAILTALVALSPIFVPLVFPRPSNVDDQLILQHFGWLAHSSLLGIAVSAFAWGGVVVFHRLTPELDSILTPDGRCAYDRWANFATATLPQLTFGSPFRSWLWGRSNLHHCRQAWHSDSTLTQRLISPSQYRDAHFRRRVLDHRWNRPVSDTRAPKTCDSVVAHSRLHRGARSCLRVATDWPSMAHRWGFHFVYFRFSAGLMERLTPSLFS